MAIDANLWGKDKYEDMIKAGALKPAENIVSGNIELVRDVEENVVDKKLSKRGKNDNVVTSVKDVINDSMAECIREQAMADTDNGDKDYSSEYIDDDIFEDDDTVIEEQSDYIDDDCEDENGSLTNEIYDNTANTNKEFSDEFEDYPPINVPVNAGQLKSFSFNTKGMLEELEKPMSTADVGVLDYLHKIEENVDKNTEGIVDMPPSSLSTLLNAMVAVLTNSAEILETLSNKLSEVDKKLSALYHACEFSSTFINPQLKIDCFDEIHKLRIERREIKNKYNLISAVRDNSTNLCKKFKPSVLSAIDKVKNPEEFEPQYEVDLCKKLTDDLTVVDKFFEDDEESA